ncbi:unnamed protein product [Psylliodes chrysocephalus]|uniref:Uncharacterized protein n=1 Tax=Psylliodes chrysocephalus TaxID=3402493 RepID=A0A9P0GIA3_9CUCU|nr:unnamed protein product [Psylliodes chrysocephala]
MDPMARRSKDMEENPMLNRKTLSEVMLECSSTKFEDRCHHILTHIMELTQCHEEMLHVIKLKLSYFNSDFKVKFKSAQFKKERFFAQNKKWLDTDVMFPVFNKLTRTVLGGRPSLYFTRSSKRSKRRKTKKVQAQLSSDELVNVAQMNLRSKGK